MTDAFALLWPPFLVALALVGIHAYLGLHVLARGVVFVDLALAQLAALGATVAFMLGHPAQGPAALGYSLAFTLLAAVLLAFTRQWSGRIPQEALIGVIYVVAAAAAFLLVDRAPQGAEHIKQILTGNILTAGTEDLASIVPLYLVVGVLHWLARRRLAQPGSGWSGWLWEFFFYASFGIVVTSSVALGGVLLVFSCLIIPAAIGVLFADAMARRLAIGWTVGTLASLTGLVASYALNLPTGAAMVCSFGAALGLAGVVRWLHDAGGARLRRASRAVRAIAAAVLAVSGATLALAPRADQPLLDALEYAVPAARLAYMSAREAEIHGDADRYSERYRNEIERLNALEARSRWDGRALDDSDVRRISSFLQSYGEMRKGEEFVKREVRGRARERVRWVLGGGLIVLGLLVAPVRVPAILRARLARGASATRKKGLEA
jgi:zinc/manganese transport system permease protein